MLGSANLVHLPHYFVATHDDHLTFTSQTQLWYSNGSEEFLCRKTMQHFKPKGLNLVLIISAQTAEPTIHITHTAQQKRHCTARGVLSRKFIWWYRVEQFTVKHGLLVA